MIVPGEFIAKYLRLRCLNNIRGGNIINTRHISIRGSIISGQ